MYSEDCYWYRAEVVALPDPDVVKVKYVDYGNVGLVPRVTLRRPKAHYLLLPAQALECRLANIRPPCEVGVAGMRGCICEVGVAGMRGGCIGDDWTAMIRIQKWCERASLLLSTMTKDRPLIAVVTSVQVCFPCLDQLFPQLHPVCMDPCLVAWTPV